MFTFYREQDALWSVNSLGLSKHTHYCTHMIHTVYRKMQYDRESLIEIAVYIVAEIAVYRTNRLKINML